jgi:hypothetical protein
MPASLKVIHALSRINSGAHTAITTAMRLARAHASLSAGTYIYLTSLAISPAAAGAVLSPDGHIDYYSLAASIMHR